VCLGEVDRLSSYASCALLSASSNRFNCRKTSASTTRPSVRIRLQAVTHSLLLSHSPFWPAPTHNRTPRADPLHCLNQSLPGTIAARRHCGSSAFPRHPGGSKFIEGRATSIAAAKDRKLPSGSCIANTRLRKWHTRCRCGNSRSRQRPGTNLNCFPQIAASSPNSFQPRRSVGRPCRW
jgi:hypothetical protein